MMNAATAPLVSIIIPTRGRRALLQETLDSVRAQSLTNWEAVVVDDHSPDDTGLWLRELAATEPRVRPMLREGDRGGANIARNQGVAASRGKYIIFLDSDDLLEPDCLLLRTRLLEAHPELDFSVHAMRCFNARPNDLERAWNTLTDEDDFERFLRLDGPWQTTGATWRRSAVDRIGPWDPQILSLQDLDFHVRALSAGLRYRKVNLWDCHYRLPFKRDTISEVHQSLNHFKSHGRIVCRLLKLHDSTLDATPFRRDLVSGFTFFVANRCAEKGDIQFAIHLWSQARRRGFVSWKRFLQGVLIFFAQKRPKFGRSLKKRIFRSWPLTWRTEFRSTFLIAPLPPRATAEAIDACFAQAG